MAAILDSNENLSKYDKFFCSFFWSKICFAQNSKLNFGYACTSKGSVEITGNFKEMQLGILKRKGDENMSIIRGNEGIDLGNRREEKRGKRERLLIQNRTNLRSICFPEQ